VNCNIGSFHILVNTFLTVFGQNPVHNKPKYKPDFREAQIAVFGIDCVHCQAIMSAVVNEFAHEAQNSDLSTSSGPAGSR